VNQDTWTANLSKSACPPWPCPACGRGHVALVADSLEAVETAKSVAARADRDWEPYWVEYAFVAWGKCTDPRCGETFAMAGDGGANESFDPDEGPAYPDYFTPRVCVPMPPLIDVSSSAPAPLSAALEEAFSVFWISPAACAGRLRVAVERLMDHVGVAKTRPNKKGAQRRLTLNQRLEAFKEHNEPMGSLLIAVKWLGNTGSHDDVTAADVLDGLEIMEHVIAEVVDGRSGRISQIADRLIAKHQPEDSI